MDVLKRNPWLQPCNRGLMSAQSDLVELLLLDREDRIHRHRARQIAAVSHGRFRPRVEQEHLAASEYFSVIMIMQRQE